MAFMLEIVTPDRSFYSDEVEMVIVRGIKGDLAILDNKSPLMTPLSIGKVRIFEDDKKTERIAAVVNGYVSVDADKTTIITDSAEWPGEIDIERAREAKERAKRRLKKRTDDTDVLRAEMALRRAINRLDIAD